MTLTLCGWRQRWNASFCWFHCLWNLNTKQKSFILTAPSAQASSSSPAFPSHFDETQHFSFLLLHSTYMLFLSLCCPHHLFLTCFLDSLRLHLSDPFLSVLLFLNLFLWSVAAYTFSPSFCNLDFHHTLLSLCLSQTAFHFISFDDYLSFSLPRLCLTPSLSLCTASVSFGLPASQTHSSPLLAFPQGG